MWGSPIYWELTVFDVECFRVLEWLLQEQAVSCCLLTWPYYSPRSRSILPRRKESYCMFFLCFNVILPYASVISRRLLATRKWIDVQLFRLFIVHTFQHNSNLICILNPLIWCQEIGSNFISQSWKLISNPDSKTNSNPNPIGCPH